MKRAIRSRRKVYGQLLAHARRQPHRECCGILAGHNGVITQAFPAKNVAADPVRNYEIAPKEIVRLMGQLASDGYLCRNIIGQKYLCFAACAERLAPNSNVVTLSIDSGLKYVGTDLYRTSRVG